MPPPLTIRDDSDVINFDGVSKLVKAIPARYQMMVLLAMWCRLRFTEITELRRKDVDLDSGVIRVRRSVLRRDTFQVITLQEKTGRSRARDVLIPSHLLEPLRSHLADNVEPDSDGLLFPARQGGHMAPSSLQHFFYKARRIVDMPDLRFEDLRHLTLSGTDDAAELMEKLNSPPPAPRKVRKTAGARKVMNGLVVAVNSYALVVGEMDPCEVDPEQHNDDITTILQGMAKIGRFLNKVKEQDR